LFNYRKDGKWLTEECEPEFIEEQLIANAKSRWITQQNPNSFWRGDKRGKGLDLILCKCDAHFLGTKRVDYSCCSCNAHVKTLQENFHGSIDSIVSNGRRKRMGRVVSED
jgi:hypothetical protein